MNRKLLSLLFTILALAHGVLALKVGKISKSAMAAEQSAMIVDQTIPPCVKLEFVMAYLMYPTDSEEDCTMSQSVIDFETKMVGFLESVIKDLAGGVDADDDVDYREEMGVLSEEYSTESDALFEEGNLKERSLILDLETVAIFAFQGYKYSTNTTEKVQIIEGSVQMLEQIETTFGNQTTACGYVDFQEEFNSQVANITGCSEMQEYDVYYYEETPTDIYSHAIPYMKSGKSIK